MKGYLIVVLCLCFIQLCFSQQAGSLDNSFDLDGTNNLPVGIANSFGRSVTVQHDGKILVAALCSKESDNDFGLLRFGSDGKLDSTFGTQGIIFTDFGAGSDIVESVALDSFQRIIVSGYADNGNGFDFAIARYTIEGNLDTAFGESGLVRIPIGITAFCKSMAVQNGNKILLGGYALNGFSLTNEFVLLRLNENGSLDSAFGENGIVITSMLKGSGIGNAIAIDAENNIYQAGQVFNETSFLWEIGIVRYTVDGDLDPLWGEDGRLWTSVAEQNFTINSIALQSDRKVIVGGFLGTAPSNNLFVLARYDHQGEQDSTFGHDGVVIHSFGAQNNQINSIVLQADNKIVIAGTTLIGNKDRFAIARLQANGAFDESFGDDGRVISWLGENDGIEAVALQPDGKLVMTGESLINGKFELVIARYLTGLPTSIKHNQNPVSSIRVFPNPIHDLINISIASQLNDQAFLDLYDSKGRFIHSFGTVQIERLVESNSSFTWPSNISEGIYYLGIRGRRDIHPVKIVKAN